DGSWSESNKEREGSLGSVTGRKLDGESSGGVSSETGSEEEETAIRSPFSEPRMVDPGMVGCETNDAGEPALVTHGERMVGNLCSHSWEVSQEEIGLKTLGCNPHKTKVRTHQKFLAIQANSTYWEDSLGSFYIAFHGILKGNGNKRSSVQTPEAAANWEGSPKAFMGHPRQFPVGEEVSLGWHER
ncbi:hypothetical protein U1Q18_010714, partial [Sarracenia purpurea var. burkii]